MVFGMSTQFCVDFSHFMFAILRLCFYFYHKMYPSKTFARSKKLLLRLSRATVLVSQRKYMYVNHMSEYQQSNNPTVSHVFRCVVSQQHNLSAALFRQDEKLFRNFPFVVSRTRRTVRGSSNWWYQSDTDTRVANLLSLFGVDVSGCCVCLSICNLVV